MKIPNKNILSIKSHRLIDDMYDLEERYRKQFGCSPYNISSWDPSDEFKSDIIKHLRLPDLGEVIGYKFSDDIEEKPQVITKLGYDTKSSKCLITPTGSISILCALNWLQHKGIKTLHIICPCYYTILYHCRKISIKPHITYLKKIEDDFVLGVQDKANLKSASAVWVNNPIYCTGKSFSKEIIECLVSVLENGGYVVSDECMSTEDSELVRHLGQYPGFIGIHSPHKALSINMVKFSAVVFQQANLKFYENWADVLYGCLLSSNILALKHYLSSNFDSVRTEVITRSSIAYEYIESILATTNNCFVDKKPNGTLISLYQPDMPAGLCARKTFLWEVFKNTGTSFIPGNRYLIDPEGGLCLRINLSRDNLLFRSSLVRLVDFLSAHSS